MNKNNGFLFIASGSESLIEEQLKIFREIGTELKSFGLIEFDKSNHEQLPAEIRKDYEKKEGLQASFFDDPNVTGVVINIYGSIAAFGIIEIAKKITPKLSQLLCLFKGEKKPTALRFITHYEAIDVLVKIDIIAESEDEFKDYSRDIEIAFDLALTNIKENNLKDKIITFFIINGNLDTEPRISNREENN